MIKKTLEHQLQVEISFTKIPLQEQTLIKLYKLHSLRMKIAKDNLTFNLTPETDQSNY